jgi:RES domain-containing protein
MAYLGVYAIRNYKTIWQGLKDGVVAAKNKMTALAYSTMLKLLQKEEEVLDLMVWINTTEDLSGLRKLLKDVEAQKATMDAEAYANLTRGIENRIAALEGRLSLENKLANERKVADEMEGADAGARGKKNLNEDSRINTTSSALESYLKNLKEKPLPNNYSGNLYKSVSKDSEIRYGAKPDEISDFSIEEAWGRYDTKGEGAMYYSKTFEGNKTEMSFYNKDWDAYSTYEYRNINMDNLLDLTDDVTRQKLGIQSEDLVRDALQHPTDITKDVKLYNYEITNIVGTWARENGYSGLIVQGARGDKNYANIIIFTQSDVTNSIAKTTPLKLK